MFGGVHVRTYILHASSDMYTHLGLRRRCMRLYVYASVCMRICTYSRVYISASARIRARMYTRLICMRGLRA